MKLHSWFYLYRVRRQTSGSSCDLQCHGRNWPVTMSQGFWLRTLNVLGKLVPHVLSVAHNALIAAPHWSHWSLFFPMNTGTSNGVKYKCCQSWSRQIVHTGTYKRRILGLHKSHVFVWYLELIQRRVASCECFTYWRFCSNVNRGQSTRAHTLHKQMGCLNLQQLRFCGDSTAWSCYPSMQQQQQPSHQSNK